MGCMDYDVSLDEIKSAFQSSKQGKSCGIDGVGYEILSCIFTISPQFFITLFNKILHSGSLPEQWKISLIVPVFKKGSLYEPNNYRGISLTPCISKILERILNERLLVFCKKNNILSEFQLGFVKGNRTSDAQIMLHNLIDKYCFKQKNRIFSCFVDFEKAFDRIPRSLLLKKLENCGVVGKFLNVIISMYSNNIAHLKMNNKISDRFITNIGVRQGCVLSPTLFNIFMADFSRSLSSDHSLFLDDKVKIACVLWADDIVLLSETKIGLQSHLDVLYKYASNNKLQVNIEKTKCLCFNKSGRYIRNYLSDNNQLLDDVRQFKYLGFLVTANGNIKAGLDDLYARAAKIYYALKSCLGYAFSKDISVCVRLYDALVKPVLLYCSDFWGLNPMCRKFICPAEKLTNIFYKHLLQVTGNVSTYTLHLELNKYPISIEAQKNCINNWQRIHFESNCNSILENNYKHAKQVNLKWYTDVSESLKLANLGFLLESNLFIRQKGIVTTTYVKNIKETYLNLANQFCSLSSKYSFFYRLRQLENFYFPLYLNKISNTYIRSLFSKLRMSCHGLSIESGRYTNTAKQHRICPLCKNGVEDELHFVFTCNFFSDLQFQREFLLQRFYDYHKTNEVANVELFHLITNDRFAYEHMATYLNVAFKRRKQSLQL